MIKFEPTSLERLIADTMADEMGERLISWDEARLKEPGHNIKGALPQNEGRAQVQEKRA